MDEFHGVLTRRDLILIEGRLLTALYIVFASELLTNFLGEVNSDCHLEQPGDILLAEMAYPSILELLNGVF